MRQHRHLFPNTKTIFLTSHLEHVFEAYEVAAYRFLKKPTSPEKLDELFASIEQERVLSQTISIRNQRTEIAISIGDIIYIEVYNNYTFVITQHNTWKCYMRLKDFYELLPEKYFYQPNKSYLINMNHIKKADFSNHKFIMANNLPVDIALRKRKECKELYTHFLLNS